MIEEQITRLSRVQLYNEIWEISVTGVAKKYNVPYLEMMKLCKIADIPIPPSGYWTKLKFGKPVTKKPLPESSIKEVTLLSEIKLTTETVDERVFHGVKISGRASESLSFLSEEERESVLIAAQRIKLTSEASQLHKKINSYKTVVMDWNEKDKKTKGAQRSPNNYFHSPPFLAGVISNESLPRVLRILDALFQQLESLGGSVNDDLSLQIRNEHVSFEIFEAQDKIEHEITKQEAQAMSIYEDDKRLNRWGSKPQIRKYDYIFNGRLKISIRKGIYFKDTEKNNLEGMLGYILLELYEKSEEVRISRESCEEEARLRDERYNLYNAEVERTIALENEALDYEKACRIRAYIDGIENVCEKKCVNDETVAWIEWARKKADWYDPIIARDDEIFGKREHDKSESQKVIKKSPHYKW